MALTSIGQRKTPGRPIEITFESETGLPSDEQEVLLIGHAASGATGTYTVININNSGDLVAASGEVATKFGDGSELAKMVLAAVKACEGLSEVPALKCIPLASTDTDFGASDAALLTLKRVKAEYVVSCYDGEDTTLGDKLEEAAEAMSAAARTDNDQYGTVAVLFNRNVADPSLYHKYDSQYVAYCAMRDSASPTYSLGEMAAACAARMASNLSPFNPLDGATLGGIDAPSLSSDWFTLGADLESEAALKCGVTPLYVKPNGDVAFVRTVTTRLTQNADGVTDVTAYYDVQDFNVLYFFRKTIHARFDQEDFRRRKASQATAIDIKSETIRLMRAFEDQGMFQKVDEFCKLVIVERNVSDRHRFDVKIPVNVVPGLHVIAANITASTQFDLVTV